MVSGDPNAWKRGFGSRPRAVDDEYRSRIKGVPRKRLWTKSKCTEELEFILGQLKKVLVENDKINKGGMKLKAESIRDLNNMMSKILDFMKYLYPPVQQNLNLNIDVTANAVLERLKNWKQEQIVVIGDEDEKKKE